VIGAEALLPQAVANFGVLLFVEQGDGQANIEVVGAWMRVAGVWIGPDLPVDEDAGTRPPTMHNSSISAPSVTATVRQADLT
jgi:hypothetical protein